ncbi:MAG TPA: aldo/keto reductase [Burkholderiales bacterium]|jgi:diketogulonate reductase-like aldo/keto reductase
MDPRRRALLALLAAGYAARPSFAQNRIMTKPIPSTKEALPVIGCGTWQTFDVGSDPGARAPLREVLKLLERNIVDSSPMYGSSESVAGDLIAELGLRDKLFIATKVWTSGREAGIRQMETSFKRLRVQQMDLMQVHNLVDVGTHTKTLQEWKAQKKVRYIGITHYTASAYAEVERALKSGPYDFLQINYSLGERDAEKRILPLAKEKNMAVIANRPFAEGALFRRVKGKALPPWAAQLGIASWAQFFLKWIVSHPALTCAIPGTGNPKHMQDNLGAGAGRLPDETERRKMTAFFDAA